jgi:uncharacterized protein YsxB (DUF464 family)
LTNIYVFKIKKINCETINKILIKGHTGYKKKGEDIVCASLSFIVESFSFYIIKYFGIDIEKRDKEKVLIELDFNRLYKNLEQKDTNNKTKNNTNYDKNELINFFVNYLLESLKLLEKNYGDFIKVEEKLEINIEK